MNNEKYNTLVIGPGGNKGYIELGALYYCEKEGLIDELEHIAGVSVGSIIGLLYTCGLSITDILNNAVSAKLLDLKNLLSLQDMATSHGLFGKNTFRDSLDKIIRNKLGYVPNMLQLYQETGVSYTAVTTSIVKPIGEAVYIDKQNNPELDCITACLMSSNIPGLFDRMSINGVDVVDGGLSNPYPIDIFDSPEYNVLAISVNSYTPYKSFVDYLHQSLQIPLGQLKKKIMESHINDNVTHLELDVELETISSFYVSAEEKKNMFVLGHKIAKDFFTQSEQTEVDNEEEPIYDEP